jgi:hypothetical protein
VAVTVGDDAALALTAALAWRYLNRLGVDRHRRLHGHARGHVRRQESDGEEDFTH